MAFLTRSSIERLPNELIFQVLTHLSFEDRFALITAIPAIYDAFYLPIIFPLLLANQGGHVYVFREAVAGIPAGSGILLGKPTINNGSIIVEACHPHQEQSSFVFGYQSKHIRRFLRMFFPTNAIEYNLILNWEQDCRGKISIVGDKMKGPYSTGKAVPKSNYHGWDSSKSFEDEVYIRKSLDAFIDSLAHEEGQLRSNTRKVIYLPSRDAKPQTFYEFELRDKALILPL
ncbi:hypothetical protein VNI00_015805 [Paramarasmius palmivorus]|uniref:F-box domain-containing protein n=1 Tax=Paramarasmius palmivorus TaxID=297713 RepID=A0AAW0BIX4_9AGAR